jgi:hypothetical protein
MEPLRLLQVIASVKKSTQTCKKYKIEEARGRSRGTLCSRPVLELKSEECGAELLMRSLASAEHGVLTKLSAAIKWWPARKVFFPFTVNDCNLLSV